MMSTRNQPARRTSPDARRGIALPALAAACAVLVLSGCTSLGERSIGADSLRPVAKITPPSDQVARWTMKGSGDISYECRQRGGSVSAFEWVTGSVQMTLKSSVGETVGRVYEGPTWEFADGSKVVAEKTLGGVNSLNTDSLYEALFKVTQGGGSGVMSGIDYVQRLNPQGGEPPKSSSCRQADNGRVERVPFTADYVFFTKRTP